jgi:hypothetical protein
VITLALLAAMAAGCTTSGPSAGRGDPVTPHPDGGRSAVALGRAITAGLVRTDDCGQLLSALKRRAQRAVTPYGLSGIWGGGYLTKGSFSGARLQDRAAIPTPLTAHTNSLASAGLPGGSSDHSTTNNQEAGVDEPDLAKTDGRVLAVLRHGPHGMELRLIDVSSGEPSLAGRLRLDGLSDAQLFLDGDKVVVVGSHGPWYGGDVIYARSPGLVGGPWGPPPGSVRVVVVDISDLSAPTVQRRLHVPGMLVDARLEAGRVVTVTQASPRLRFHHPHHSGREARRDALRANRGVIERSTLADWLPLVRTDSGQTWDSDCASVYRSERSDGFGAVSVTSIDPSATVPGHQVTVLTDASTVYASTDTVYIATTAEPDRTMQESRKPGEVRTRLHAFDVTDPDHPTYLASGSVRGSLLDNYSLSENDGYLRVVTTVGTASPAPGEGLAHGRLANNRVVVLRPEAGRLMHVGHVGDFGRGERIYSVRFLGDLGYVVTFRQIDPLFVLDLSDPAAPALRGELKMPGYSSYLHPLGGDLVFGLGAAVDSHLAPQGVQTSVFDVSDPDAPKLQDKLVFPHGWSAAADDPHAFLWWPDTRIVVLPLAESSRTEKLPGDIVLRVSDDGSLQELGRVTQPSSSRWGDGIERALVIGGLLYTVSQNGVLVSDLHSLASESWLRFR